MTGLGTVSNIPSCFVDLLRIAFLNRSQTVVIRPKFRIFHTERLNRMSINVLFINHYVLSYTLVRTNLPIYIGVKRDVNRLFYLFCLLNKYSQFVVRFKNSFGGPICFWFAFKRDSFQNWDFRTSWKTFWQG
jgi:hypothetical protein